MSRQASFSDLEYVNKKRRTRRELFLAEMEAVVPWQELLGVVEPHYPRAGGRGRPPVGLASMLRIYFLQQWFALSDRQMEDALYDIESLRRFAGFPDVTAALPDETTNPQLSPPLGAARFAGAPARESKRAAEGQRVAGVARDDG